MVYLPLDVSYKDVTGLSYVAREYPVWPYRC